MAKERTDAQKKADQAKSDKAAAARKKRVEWKRKVRESNRKTEQ